MWPRVIRIKYYIQWILHDFELTFIKTRCKKNISDLVWPKESSISYVCKEGRVGGGAKRKSAYGEECVIAYGQ